MSGNFPDLAHWVLLGQLSLVSCHRKYSVHNLGAANLENSRNDEFPTRKDQVCHNIYVK